MRPSVLYRDSVATALRGLEHALFQPPVMRSDKLLHDNQTAYRAFHAFYHTWHKYSDNRNSPAILDSQRTFSFWVPETAAKGSRSDGIRKIEESFALSDDDALFRAKVCNILHRADCRDFAESAARFPALRPLLRRSLEMLRRYGLFVAVQAECGALFALSETEAEVLGVPSKHDPQRFYTDRGWAKISANRFAGGALIQLLDAVVSLEKFYDAWRGTVVRPNVTVVFTFCHAIFRKPSITLDGCIFLPMDGLASLQDYFFSISANEWSACQVCAQKYRHENAPHRIELDNRGVAVARDLGVKSVSFVITPGTDPQLVDERTTALSHAKRTIFAAKEKYPALTNENFKMHLQIRFAVFCDAENAGEVMTIDDTGVLCLSLTASVQQLLKSILDYGDVAVERAKFYEGLINQLKDLRKQNRRVFYEIAPQLRTAMPQKYLSCFAHFLDTMQKSESIHKLLYQVVIREQNVTISISESGKVRKGYGGYFVPWNMRIEEFVEYLAVEEQSL